MKILNEESFLTLYLQDNSLRLTLSPVLEPKYTVQISILSFTGCVMLDKLFNFTVPQFLHQNGDNNTMSLRSLF